MSAGRRGLTTALAALAAVLLGVGTAWAHAVVSPPVAKTGVLQMFTLAVPTERGGATTTGIQLTVPAGVQIDSFEAEPGWTRHINQTGTGESAIIRRVTWTGGRVPTGEDSVFRFLATLTGGSSDYVFSVRQTYSDGTVVDWNGPESSDTPSPVVQGVSSLGGGSGQTLAVIALAVGAAGVLIGAVAIVAGRGGRSLT